MIVEMLKEIDGEIRGAVNDGIQLGVKVVINTMKTALTMKPDLSSKELVEMMDVMEKMYIKSIGEKIDD